MDSNEMAEVRILAKKMLRKKERSEILDSTYNRYSGCGTLILQKKKGLVNSTATFVQFCF